MLERLPRYPILAGSALLVIGTAVTVILVARRSHCSANRYSDNSVVSELQPQHHWAFVIILLGAVLFVAAALAGSNWVQSRNCHGASKDHPGHSDRLLVAGGGPPYTGSGATRGSLR